MKFQKEVLHLILAIVLAFINAVLVRHWISYEAKSYVLPLWQYVLTALGCCLIFGYIGNLLVLWFKPLTYWRWFLGLTLMHAIAFSVSKVILDHVALGIPFLEDQSVYVLFAGPILFSPIVAPFTALTSFLLMKCK